LCEKRQKLVLDTVFTTQSWHDSRYVECFLSRKRRTIRQSSENRLQISHPHVSFPRK